MGQFSNIVAGFALAIGIGGSAAPAPVPVYEIVIRDGRVIDPETGLDAVRHVGLRDGRIEAVSEQPLKGRTTIDARGMVVAPGFIDVHSHASANTPSGWMQAFDGVTTALELELGAFPVGAAYAAAAAEGRPIHYGFSVGWRDARKRVMGARSLALATDAERARVIEQVAKGLDEGGLGIGIPLGYAVDVGRTEYWELGRLAAERNVPTFTHVRTKNTREPRGAIEGFSETIAVAATTGAHMHICHINSSALRELPRITAMIRKAQSYGVPVSTEAYPWGAGSTWVNAPFLQPDNLEMVNIESSDIEYLATGERPATKARLAEIQKADPEGMVVVHYLDENKPEEATFLEQATIFPDGLIASDAIAYGVGGKTVTEARWPLPAGAMAHPRVAATFTTVLGTYVRERRLLSLPDAIRRSTLLPARLLEPVAPGMKNKGRLRAGADADIVVFDPETVAGVATYERPNATARGMRWVIVGGEVLIRDGKLDPKVRPGRAIRGPGRGGGG